MPHTQYHHIIDHICQDRWYLQHLGLTSSNTFEALYICFYIKLLYVILKCVHAIGQNHITWHTLNRNIGLTRHYCLHEYSCLSILPSLIIHVSLIFRYDFHTGWNISKIISRPNSLRPMRLLTPTWAIWCNGNMEKFGGDQGWGGVLDYKSGNISETRKDRGKVTMESL